MFKGSLPFDDISGSNKEGKNIPRGYDAFVEYIDFLATSPNIDAGFVSNHILQFLNMAKVKVELKKAVLFALGSMQLPEDFWTSLFSQFKSQFTPKWELAEGMLTALSAAPVSAIIQEFNKISFINQFLVGTSPDVKFAALAALYNLRDHISITPDIVNEVIADINAKLPKLVFIVINWIMFLLSIDYQNIREMIMPHKDTLSEIIVVYGHLLNERQLSFLINFTNPTLAKRIQLVNHLSIPSACFILASLSSSPDYNYAEDMPLSTVIPLMIDYIKNPMSEGARNELLISALDLLRVNKAVTANKQYFDKIVDLMFSSPGVTDYRLASLLASVSQQFNTLPVVIAKSAIDSKNQNILPVLISVSCEIAEKQNIDIISELLKMYTLPLHNENWRIAAAAGIHYIWVKRAFTELHFQEIFNVAQSINDQEVKALLIIILAYFVPINQRSPLVEEAKKSLFPHLFVPYKETYKIAEYEHRTQLPTMIRIELAHVISALAQGEELEDIEDLLKAPLLSSFTKLPLNTNALPINPFMLCHNTTIGSLAAALEFPSHVTSFDFLGISRKFTRISPESHALCVEIASTVTGKHKSMALDIRLSVKQFSPDITVYFDIPTSFTPPRTQDWHITDLDRGSKVTRRITFTANKMNNPFISIRAEKEGHTVLNLKVCVPILDMFDKIDPNGEVASNLWHKMRFEKTGVNLPDSMWVCWNGCVGVKNGVARADEESFLKMLPSAFTTTAVLD